MKSLSRFNNFMNRNLGWFYTYSMSVCILLTSSRIEKFIKKTIIITIIITDEQSVSKNSQYIN